MIDSRILVGLVAMLIALSSVVYVGINEADRQAEFKRAFAGRQVETGASLFGEFCAPCHSIKGEGIPGRAPALNTAEFFGNRTKELGYQGSIESYIKLTVASGRPAQSTSGPWAENMPTWSVDYGGPMRNDQIDAVTAYVMSWGNKFEEGVEFEAAPLDCDTSEECGELLFQSMGCVGCHMINGEGGGVGPDLTNVYTEKGEDHIRQSILLPNAVIADGYQPDVMPKNFGERLTDQNIDEIIAYFASVSR